MSNCKYCNAGGINGRDRRDADSGGDMGALGSSGFMVSEYGNWYNSCSLYDGVILLLPKGWTSRCFVDIEWR